MTQTSTSPQATSAWPDALYRGTVLGVVAACHLALLALLLRHTPYRESHQRVPANRADDALQLIFIASVTPTPVARASIPPRPRPLPARLPPTQRTKVTPRTPSSAAPMMVIRVAPQPTSDPATPEYQAGDFRARLHDAQRARVVPVPGSTSPPVDGLRMRAAPSGRDLLRQLAVSTRCTAMQFDMQKKKNQFITAQLMDRLLEADGCGPHSERTSATDAVDTLTRQLLDQR